MSKSKHTVDILQLVEKDDKPSKRVIVLLNMPQIQKAVDLGYTRKKFLTYQAKRKLSIAIIHISCAY